MADASDDKTIECTEDFETFRSRKPNNLFRVWKGRDFWHQDLSVQVRLEPDGMVYLSTQGINASTLVSKTVTLEEFYNIIRSAIT